MENEFNNTTRIGDDFVDTLQNSFDNINRICDDLFHSLQNAGEITQIKAAVINYYRKAIETHKTRVCEIDEKIKLLEIEYSKKDRGLGTNTKCLEILKNQFLDEQIVGKKEIEVYSLCNIIVKDKDIIAKGNFCGIYKGKLNTKDKTIKRYSIKDIKSAQTEMKNLLALDHKNLFNICYYGLNEHHIYFLDDPMTGTVHNFLEGRYSIAPIHQFTIIAKMVMRQILNTTDYIHSKGLVLKKLSLHDVLVDNGIYPSKIKIANISSMIPSLNESDRLDDLSVIGKSFYFLLSKTDWNQYKTISDYKSVFKRFADWCSAEDAILKLIKAPITNKTIDYYLSHPVLYSEEEMLCFISDVRDELVENKFHGKKEQFIDFRCKKKDRSWFSELDESVSKALHRNNSLWEAEKIKAEKSKKKSNINNREEDKKNEEKFRLRFYDGRFWEQVYDFARNYHRHQHPIISGMNYPQSQVDNLIRRIPDLMSNAYNNIYEIKSKIKCQKLKARLLWRK